MKKSKIVAAYLPQYHETPDNSEYWGEGFTDWIAVKDAKPQFDGHIQPKEPLDGYYYDLSDYNAIKWQAELAKKYGVDAFNIYHYWFKDGKQELEKPAEILLSHPEIDIEYFFSWDNSSWIRSWSNVVGGNSWAPNYDGKNDGKQILQELDYGNEEQWRKHFDYLLPFFKDKRYVKINGKPVFGFMKSGDGDILTHIRDCWRKLALENGFPGIYLISSQRTFFDPHYFDNIFLYEPVASGWGKRIAIEVRLKKYLNYVSKSKGPVKFLLDYENYWKKVIRNAEKNKDNGVFLCGLVNFDDTPRRGNNARIIYGGTPKLFKKYFSRLYRISCEADKELLFITAWNEWGEGAYLEPDKVFRYGFLEALRSAKREIIGEV